MEDEHDSYSNALWIDMPIFSRFLHVLKQVPCYLLLFLYPFFYPCIFPSNNNSESNPAMIPWFCKEWRVPLNRAIYTAFSYCLFITLVLCYVYEPPKPYIYWVDAALAVFITSYFFRDIGRDAKESFWIILQYTIVKNLSPWLQNTKLSYCPKLEWTQSSGVRHLNIKSMKTS